jgi:hypothetical protein
LAVRPAFCGRQDRALWQSGGETEKDSIAVVEVMVVEIGGSYWHSRCERLEREHCQDKIVIRAEEIRRL